MTEEKKPQNEVTIRYLSSSAVVETYEFARELGYLGDINITRRGSNTGGPEDIISVATGSTDVGHAAWVAIINAKARGAEIKGISAPMGNSPENWYEGTPYLSKWLVLENSSIRSAKDLAGKKIAVHTLGGHAEYVTREYLARNNMLKGDVQLITMSHHEEVLRQGQVDVVAPVGVQIDRMEANGGIRVLFTDYDVIGNQTHCGLFMSEKFMRENPETAKYWKGFGVREHAILVDSDVQFWIDWLVSDGKLKGSQFKPADIYTNEFNPYYRKTYYPSY